MRQIKNLVCFYASQYFVSAAVDCDAETFCPSGLKKHLIASRRKRLDELGLGLRISTFDKSNVFDKGIAVLAFASNFCIIYIHHRLVPGSTWPKLRRSSIE